MYSCYSYSYSNSIIIIIIIHIIISIIVIIIIIISIKLVLVSLLQYISGHRRHGVCELTAYPGPDTALGGFEAPRVWAHFSRLDF